MTISTWTVYWVSRMDHLKDFLFVLAIVSLVSGIILGMSLIAFIEEDSKDIKKYVIPLIVTFLFSLLAMPFIPTTEEMAAIYVFPKIAVAEKLKRTDQIPQLLIEFSKQWLENQIRSKNE